MPGRAEMESIRNRWCAYALCCALITSCQPDTNADSPSDAATCTKDSGADCGVEAGAGLGNGTGTLGTGGAAGAAGATGATAMDATWPGDGNWFGDAGPRSADGASLDLGFGNAEKDPRAPANASGGVTLKALHAPPLLSFASGTFTRASAGTAQSYNAAGITVADYAVDVIRPEAHASDPEGSPTTYLFEGARTNWARKGTELDGAPWGQNYLASATSANLAEPVAPDNTPSAEGVHFGNTTGATGIVSTLWTLDYPASPDRDMTMSAYHQSGPLAFSMAFAAGSSVARASGNFPPATDTTPRWRRFDYTFAYDEARMDFPHSMRLKNQSPLVAGQTTIVWGAQLEDGPFPSSFIRTPSNATASRAADQLLFTSAPAELLGGRYRFEVYPEHGSDDGFRPSSRPFGLRNADFGLLSFGAATRAIALHYDDNGKTFLRISQPGLESTANANDGHYDIAHQWKRQERIAITVDIPGSRVAIEGDWTPIPGLSAFSLDTQAQETLRIGALHAANGTMDATTSAFARISEPRPFLPKLCSASGGCPDGFTCGEGESKRFGDLNTETEDDDVCWPTECEDTAHPEYFAQYCGSIASPCGLCCVGDDELDDCAGSTSECGVNAGPRVGMSEGANACWAEGCTHTPQPAPANERECETEESTCGLCPVTGETPFLRYTDGDFARASVATAMDFDPPTRSVLIHDYAIDAIRTERRTTDPLDAAVLYLFEGVSTNHAKRSTVIGGPSWSSYALVGDKLELNAAVSPDSLQQASRIPFTASSAARVATTPFELPYSPERLWSFSVFHFAGPGRVLVVNRDGVVSNSASFAGDGLWRRYEHTTPSGTGATMHSFQLRNIETNPAATDLVAWGAQAESSPFPTSFIRVINSPLDRAPDVLRFTSTPAEINAGPWSVDVYPLHGSSDGKSGSNPLGLSNATYGLFAFSGTSSTTSAATDQYIALYYDAAGASHLRVVQGSNVTDIPVTWARHEKLTLTVDVPNHRVALGDVTRTVSSLTAFPAGRMMVGGLFASDGSQAPNSSAFARMSEPRSSGLTACDEDSDCRQGEVCGDDNGDNYGSTNARVCWPAACETDFEARCGSVNSECGVCKACDSNADCAYGESCGVDNSGAFGIEVVARVCWPRDCDYPEDRAEMCGTTSSECGECPVCVPSCDGRECGDDGCGGSCGACASGTTCWPLAGSCLDDEPKHADPPLQATGVDYDNAPDGPIATAAVGTLDGSFSVDANGGANYDIPIVVAPGIAGLQPKLSIHYNDKALNGYLGAGWSIDGFSTITRCDKAAAIDGVGGSPQQSQDDAFCIDGARLIEVGTVETEDLGSWSVAQNPPPQGVYLRKEYRTERDTSSRVYAYYMPKDPRVVGVEGPWDGPVAFEVTEKAGDVLKYRSPSWTPFKATCDDAATACQSWNRQSTWSLAVAMRPGMSGSLEANQMTVRYHPAQTGYSVPEHPEFYYAQAPIDSIAYAKRYGLVKFEYEDRSDPVATYYAGVLHRIGSRVSRIRTFFADKVLGTNPQGNAYLVREYRLHYEEDGAGISRLSSIEECAPSGSTVVCKAPTTFDYAPDAGFGALQEMIPNDHQLWYSYEAGDEDHRRLDRDLPIQVADVNGDGADDIITPSDNGASSENGGGDYRIILSQKNASTGTFDHRLVKTGVQTYKTSLSLLQYWWTAGFTGREYSGGVTSIAPVDMDGDGDDELFEFDYGGTDNQGGDRYSYVQIGTFGPDGECQGCTRIFTDIPQGTRAYASGPSGYLIDLNADQRPDLLTCNQAGSNGIWRYYLGRPGGGFQAADVVETTLHVDCEGSHARIVRSHGRSALQVPDWEGDGWTGNWYLVELTEAGELASSLGNQPTVSAADLNGDGLEDYVAAENWSEGAEDQPAQAYQFYLNTGVGDFAISSPATGLNFSPTRWGWVHMDANGDGLEDILGVLDSGAVVYAPSDGYGLGQLSQPFIADGTPLVVPNQAFDFDGEDLRGKPMLADLNGDGEDDLVYEHDERFYFSLSGRAKRGRLVRVTNGLGATVDVEYATTATADVYFHTGARCNEYLSCRRPRMTLVSAYEASDQGTADIGQERTRYEFGYRDGTSGLLGRGWLGFALMQQTELHGSEWVASRSTSTDNFTFHQETQSFPFAGVPSQVSVRRADPSFEDFPPTLIERTTTYSEVQEGSAPGTYFVYPSNTVFERITRDYQLPGDPLPEEEILDHRHRYLTYDAFGNVRTVRDEMPNGDSVLQTLTYAHDDDASLEDDWNISLLDHHEQVWETSDENVTQDTGGYDERTRSTAFEYWEGSRFLKRTVREPSDPTLRLNTTFMRDAFGNVTCVASGGTAVYDETCSSALSRNTKVEYDASNIYPNKITTSPDAGTLLETFLDFDWRTGSLHTRIDLQGPGPDDDLASEVWHDGFGRAVAERRVDGMVANVSYASGLNGVFSVSEQMPGEAPRTVSFDRGGRPIHIATAGEGGHGMEAIVVYDAQGRITSKTRPFRTGTNSPDTYLYTYDTWGRPLTETNPRGEVTTYCYRGFDTACVRDPRGFTSCTQRDALGRIVRSTDPVASSASTECLAVADSITTYPSTRYWYKFESVKYVDDVKGQRRVIRYDSIGRRTYFSDPDTHVTTYEYNAFDELERVTDANDHVSEFLYDNLGRKKQRTDFDVAGGGNAVTRWFWDYGEDGVWQSGEVLGTLRETRNPGGINRVLFSYDEIGRPTSVATTVGSRGSYEIGYEYNNLSQLTFVTYPPVPGAEPADRLVVGYDYDPVTGNVARIYNESGGGEVENYWELLGTDEYDQLYQETTGDGSLTTRLYDELGRAQAIERAQPGGVVYQAMAYSRDASGNLNYRFDAIRNSLESFTYDHLSRLSTVNGSVPIEYDALGNFVSRPGLGAYSYAPSHPNAPSTANGVSYSYDAVGNRTLEEIAETWSRNTVYTRFNKPSEVWEVNSGVEGFHNMIEYDADGKRVLKQTASATTLYAGEYEKRIPASGSPQHVFYVSNGMRTIAQVTVLESDPGAPQVSYLHDDHLGSTQFVTSGDGSQSGFTHLGERSYDAWGLSRDPATHAPTTPSPTVRIGFTSHEDDYEFGLINMSGRLYDPTIARFTTADPYVQAPFFSQSLNRYAYVWNNPLTYTDPTGFSVDGTFDCRGLECEWGWLAEYIGQRPMQVESNGSPPGAGGGATASGAFVPASYVGSVEANAGRSYGSSYSFYQSQQISDTSLPDVGFYDAGVSGGALEPKRSQSSPKAWSPMGSRGYRGAKDPWDDAFKAHDFTGYQELAEAYQFWGGEVPTYLWGVFELTWVVGEALWASAFKTAASKALPALRQQYVNAVEALAGRGAAMREAGIGTEQIARALHAERRLLGEQFKALTPPDRLAQIYERNLAKYGDKLGPSIDWLRARGKTWEQIIESATRSGGQDLGF